MHQCHRQWRSLSQTTMRFASIEPSDEALLSLGSNSNSATHLSLVDILHANAIILNQSRAEQIALFWMAGSKIEQAIDLCKLNYVSPSSRSHWSKREQ